MERERQPKDGDAGVCARRDADRAGGSNEQSMVCDLPCGLAAGAHQGWSANIYTLASDMFPRGAVGSVVGFGTLMGTIAGMVIAEMVGYILQRTGRMYLFSFSRGRRIWWRLCFVQMLAPRLERVEM